MNGPRDCPTKLNKLGREKISCDITYTWNLKKNDANKLFLKTEISSQTLKSYIFM